MKTKIPIILWLIFSLRGFLFAGDITNFANLGFSADNRYFMFAQYGVQEENSYPYADIFIVNVTTNDFVGQGVKHAVYPNPSEPGFTGEGALFNLLGENISLIQNFVTGFRYKVRLLQSVYGEKESVKSSFYIDLTVIFKNGTSKDYRIGLPGYTRKGVKSYRIKQVLLSPKGKSLIILIEKEEVDKTGSNIRYMVETVTID
jgi:predicted secreted protein